MLQSLFGEEADEVALETGFIKRRRKLNGSSYLKSLVLGWMAKPEESLGGLAQHTARVGTAVSPQNLDQRFGEGSVKFMEAMLKRAMQKVFYGKTIEAELFKGFSAVRLADSSVVALPIEYAGEYPGCGNQLGGSAGLKLQVNLELLRGEVHLALQSAKDSDRNSPVAYLSAAGELSIRDLGFLSGQSLAQIATQGGYFLTRVMPNQVFLDSRNRVIPLESLLQDGLDTTVWLSGGLEVRLVVLKVPQTVKKLRIERLNKEAKDKGTSVSAQILKLAAWDIRITNAPPSLLSLKAIFVISRLRWQIELWFKVCKSLNQIDQSRSKNPFRVLTEIFAKLLGCLVQHWCIVALAWHIPNKSLFRLATTIQAEAISLLRALPSLKAIKQWFDQLRPLVQVASTMQKRRTRPNSFQLSLSNYA